ncbi:MAG: hypothetical protein IKW74_01955 [Thermoguttaceae bacterium]|nr:hypothetical protein [Thermoguttaceae bacterium]
MKKTLIVINVVLLTVVLVLVVASVLLHGQGVHPLQVKAKTVPFELITDDSQLDFAPGYFDNFQLLYFYDNTKDLNDYLWIDKDDPKRFNGIRADGGYSDSVRLDDTIDPPQYMFFSGGSIRTVFNQRGGQYRISIKKKNQTKIGLWNQNGKSGYCFQYDNGFKFSCFHHGMEIPLRFYDLPEDVLNINVSCYKTNEKSVYVVRINDQTLCSFSDAAVQGPLTLSNTVCYRIEYSGIVERR